MFCDNCFKNVNNTALCVGCRYNQAANSLESVEYLLSPAELEEARFEVYSRLENIDRREKENMTDLMAFINKCGEPTINLAKKRFELVEELRCMLFNPNGESSYITNGDVICHLSGLPDSVTDKINPDFPVFDYIQDSFMPNALPYELKELDGAFGDTYVWSYAINVPLTLERIMRHSPTSLERRSHLAVLDTGYSYYPDSIIIPKFELVDNRYLVYQPDPSVKPVYISKDSIIPEDAVLPSTSYLAHPEKITDTCIIVNLYKVFEETLSLGMYKLMPTPAEEDINPLSLVSYAAKDVYQQKLFTTCEKFVSPLDKIQTYRDCPTIIIELEYLYNVLRLYANFNYGYVQAYLKGPSEKLLIEGIRPTNDYVAIECIIPTINLQAPPATCENILLESMLV